MKKLAFIGDNGLEGVEADSRLAVENGFDGIEYNFWGEFRDLKIDTVKQMAAIHQKYGTKAAMLGTWGFNHLAADAAERTRQRPLLEKQIEFAQVLKAEWIVTSCGQIHGEPIGREHCRVREAFRPGHGKDPEGRPEGRVLCPASATASSNSLTTMERVWEVMPGHETQVRPGQLATPWR